MLLLLLLLVVVLVLVLLLLYFWSRSHFPPKFKQAVIVRFPRMKMLGATAEDLVALLQQSAVLEVNAERKAVRLKDASGRAPATPSQARQIYYDET